MHCVAPGGTQKFAYGELKLVSRDMVQLNLGGAVTVTKLTKIEQRPVPPFLN